MRRRVVFEWLLLIACAAPISWAVGLIFYGIAVCPDLMCNRP